MKFFRQNTEICNIKPEDASTQRCVHMGENVLNITIKTTKPLTLQIGDYTIYDNTKYKVKKLVNITRKSDFEYEYIFQLFSPQYDLQDVIFRLYDNTGEGELDSSIPIFGTASFLMTQIIKCVRGVYPEWSIGSIEETDTSMAIVYNDMDCLQAIQYTAEKFGIEYWFTDTMLHIGKRKQGDPLLFKYGIGNSLYELSRQNQDGRIITRLYVKGSERNIDSSKYGNKYLLLPGKTKYVERNVDKYGIIEGRMQFTEVYPRLIHKKETDPGSVTAVRVDTNGIYWIKDKYLNFNPADCLLPGLSIKIVFQTGQLGGVKVDANWHADKQEFELIRGDYGLGQDVPGNIFVPVVGNLYLLEDLAMPGTYVADGENELQEEANRAIEQVCEQKVSYKGPVNPLYFKKLGDNISTGRAVEVEDTEIVDGTGKVSLRVQAFTRPLNDIYNIDVEISDTIYVSRISRMETDIKDIKDTTEKNFNDTNAFSRRMWRDVQETNDMLYDPEGYLTERIKALSVQATQLIIGMNSSQFDFIGVKFKPNYGGDFNDFRWESGQLVHYTVKANQATYWNINASGVYLNSAYSYYVYARCPKEMGNIGEIKVSTTPILLESEAGYWHFWVGVINTPYTMSVSGGITSTTRSFQTLHGFTEIAGDNITTGIIKSADGKTWFNLRTGEICGNITFLAGSKGWENIQGLSKEFQDLWSGLSDTWDKAINAYTLADLANKAANGAKDEAAKANALLAIYKAVFENNTDILGGLILTSMILMRTGSEVQAGMSANLNNNNLAFWAGGTYEQGLRLIQNLTDNIAKFAISHDGKLYAYDAYLKGTIEALSGRIGGLKIVGNGLTNEGFDNDAYIVFRNDVYKVFAGIGGNILPATTGQRGVARFENNNTSGWFGDSNYSLLLQATGSQRANFAISAYGGTIACLDSVFSYRYNYFIPTGGTSGNNTLPIEKGDNIIINANSTSDSVFFPGRSRVQELLGISGTFAIRLRITAHYTSPDFFINGQSSSGATYQIRDHNGSVIQNVSMSKGDTAEFLLYFDGSSYIAHLVQHKY